MIEMDEKIDRMMKAMEFVTQGVYDQDFTETLTVQQAVELIDGIFYHFLFLLELTADFSKMTKLEAFEAYGDVYRALLASEFGG